MHHATWLDNEQVLLKIKLWLAEQQVGKITPVKLQKHFNKVIWPSINAEVSHNRPLSVSIWTAQRWLHKLGYELHSHKKGVYIDGHERANVKAKWQEYLEIMKGFERQAFHLSFEIEKEINW